MLTSQDIFDRYKAVQHRLPRTRTQPNTQNIASLLDITDHIDAFVFDAFGVLNVGETPIPGAVERIADLRKAGKQIRVLTNAASYGASATQDKFKRLGFSFLPEEIITSRSAALTTLNARHWGIIAAEDDPLADIPHPHIRLDNTPSSYDAAEGFLFLSTANWNENHQATLERALSQRPRPVVIANADLAAPRDDAFSIEPGYWGHQIADRLGLDVEFHGKPFKGAFDLAAQSLRSIDPKRIALCGDSLHTDILGANAMGWHSVLVCQDGLFKDLDVKTLIAEANIPPTWTLDRI